MTQISDNGIEFLDRAPDSKQASFPLSVAEPCIRVMYGCFEFDRKQQLMLVAAMWKQRLIDIRAGFCTTTNLSDVRFFLSILPWCFVEELKKHLKFYPTKYVSEVIKSIKKV